MTLCALAALAAQGAPPARVPLDAVAAVVDRKVITVSEVEAEARLALLEKAGPGAAYAALDARFLRTVLDHAVTQELLAVEARRALAAPVKEGLVESRVDALRARFDSPALAQAFLARFGIDDELLRARARRDLMVQALLSEVLARAGQPTDDEVRRTVGDANADDARRAATRDELLRARREQAFGELMARLKRELDVRVVATFEEPTDGAAPVVGR